MTVDPNRFAGPAEAAILRGHIAAETGDLERVNGRLGLARRILDDAELALRAAQEAADSARAVVAQGEAHANALIASIGRARGLLHPIRRLPDEILSQIFFEWLTSVEATGCADDRSFQSIPFTCSSVCRRWRGVALGTPLLWTRVSVNFMTVEQSSEAWVRYVNALYDRSRKLPLNIHITTWTYKTEPADISCQLIWRLLTMMSRRCRSLTVVCMYSLQDPHLETLLRGRAPVLEHLELGSYNTRRDTDLPIQIFDDLPCLRELHIDSVAIMWDLGRRFSGARKLYLAREPAGMDVPLLARVAKRVPNLEELIFENDIAAAPPGSDEVCFARLRRLEVSGNIAEDAASVLRFPTLHTAVLSLMRCPESVVSMSLAHSANLSTLRLVRTCLSAGLASALAVLGRLQELESSNSSVTDEFLRRLARPNADGTWICPLLRRLHLCAVLPKDRETFDGSSLIALLKARRDAASGSVAALHDVKATWAKGMDYSVEGFQDELQQLIS